MAYFILGRATHTYVPGRKRLVVYAFKWAKELGGMGTTDSADGRQPRGVSSHGPFGKTLAIKAARVRADIAFALTDALVVVAAYVIALALRLLDPGVSDRYWPELMAHLPLLVVLHIGANVVTGAYGHVWEHASIAEAKQVLFSNLVSDGDGGRRRDAVRPPDTPQHTHPERRSPLPGWDWFGFDRGCFLSPDGSAPACWAIVVARTGLRPSSREASPSLEILGFVETVETEALARGDSDHRHHRRPGEVRRRYERRAGHRRGRNRRAGRPSSTCASHRRAASVVPDPASSPHPGASTCVTSGDGLAAAPTVQTDLVAVRELLVGKRILITGGGGSIGSEIVRQVVQFAPSAVYALDRDETLLHEMLLSLGSRRDEVNPVLCDIRDYDALERHILQIRPEVVFHAAALKHVPVLEAHPDEAQKTNVRGTVNVLDALRQAGGVERFVLISTDKAVRPSSVMGASKRVAEMVVQQEAMRSQSGIFTSVRFGNVLGSRGSVVPTFIRQIQAGGPVTITDPEMTPTS